MKKIIAFGVVIGIVGLGAITLGREGTIEYIQGEVVEKEVLINPLDEQIRIREAELEEVYTKIKSVEARLDVNKAEVARLQSENVDLQKQLASFIQEIASKK